MQQPPFKFIRLQLHRPHPQMQTKKELEKQISQLASALEPIVFRGKELKKIIRETTSDLGFKEKPFRAIQEKLELNFLKFKLRNVESTIRKFRDSGTGE